MNEIERAIAILENCAHEDEAVEGIAYFAACTYAEKSDPGFMRKVREMCIAALRNQAEREEGCARCEGFANDPNWLCSVGNGQYESLIYRYCPLCGRRLEVRQG